MDRYPHCYDNVVSRAKTLNGIFVIYSRAEYNLATIFNNIFKKEPSHYEKHEKYEAYYHNPVQISINEKTLDEKLESIEATFHIQSFNVMELLYVSNHRSDFQLRPEIYDVIYGKIITAYCACGVWHHGSTIW